MAYKHFLGYEKGPDGTPQVVEEQAKTVRRIYTQFLEGRTTRQICAALTAAGIPTPAGKTVWAVSTATSILRNEKYTGKAGSAGGINSIKQPGGDDAHSGTVGVVTEGITKHVRRVGSTGGINSIKQPGGYGAHGGTVGIVAEGAVKHTRKVGSTGGINSIKQPGGDDACGGTVGI